MFNSYLDRMYMKESSGNPNARNPRSTAGGLGGFTDGTWNGLMNKYPELRLTPGGKYDPEQVKRAAPRFTFDNAAILKKNGLEPSDNNLYAMHFFGAGDGPKVLGADPNTPIEHLVSPAVMRANPTLAGKTAGQATTMLGGSPSGPAVSSTIFPSMRPRTGSGFLGADPSAPAEAPGYDFSGSLQGAGAALASIGSPTQGAALAHVMKAQQDRNADQWQMTVNPATGAVLRINKKDGRVEAMTNAVPTRSKADDAYDTHLGTELVKQREKHITNATNAHSSNKDLDALEGALANPNVPQGPWGSTRLQLMKAANLLGIADNTKDLSDADMANVVGAKMALKLRNPADGGGMPGNFSDQDRNFLMGIIPGVNLTPEANKRIIELTRAANNRAIAIDTLRRQYEKQNAGRLDAGFEDVVADWDKKHTFSSSFAQAEGQGGAAAPVSPAQRPPLSSIFK